MSGRHGSKLLTSKRSYSLASNMTRPPLLSSATRPGTSGTPDCAGLSGAHALPLDGIRCFSYQFGSAFVPGWLDRSAKIQC